MPKRRTPDLKEEVYTVSPSWTKVMMADSKEGEGEKTKLPVGKTAVNFGLGEELGKNIEVELMRYGRKTKIRNPVKRAARKKRTNESLTRATATIS